MKHLSSRAVDVLRNAPMIPILIIVVAYFSFTIDGFLSPFSMQNLLRDASVLIVAGIGGMLVFLVSGLDLSVGSTVAGASVGAAIAAQSTGSLFVAVLAGLAIGLVVGVVNGLLVGYAKLVAFILTLGMLLIVKALAYLAAALVAGEGGTAGAVAMPPEATVFGRGVTFGIPNVFYAAAAVVIVIAIVLARTRYGRQLRLIGQNEEAARFNGVDVRFIKLTVYSLAGLLSGLAGVLLAFRLGSGSPAAGDALLLQVITAVIIGGTTLTGGHGGAFRTLFGALVIIAIDKGLSAMGLQFWDQQIALGIVILLGTQVTRFWNAKRRLA
ncbi:ABC transporter permease [Leucobacter allii]|uniref:ABC transporter permease n=1 Tax=Leucobacter allii TaxID=2932247 RepID=UPI001FD165A4|nr:ABC transporter permease [Leucobacter allii]UOR01356.1 ABC transporter permease [Leucobacter allii]